MPPKKTITKSKSTLTASEDREVIDINVSESEVEVEASERTQGDSFSLLMDHTFCNCSYSTPSLPHEVASLCRYGR